MSIKFSGLLAMAAFGLFLSHTCAAADEPPAFDCAKAQGEVQTLICSDAKLAALDRQLDAVFKQAAARSKGAVLKNLKAGQRGWIKGRDECWKSRDGNTTYLTESWQVADVRSCIDATYRLRIAELQVLWQLAKAQKAVSYTCNGNAAHEVIAQLFATELPAGRFERGDESVVGYLVQSPDGPRYEGRNLRFAAQDGRATVTWLGDTLDCKAR
jgi:uncharacterized protein